jgi:hypothetical protein
MSRALREGIMKRIAFLFVAVVTVRGVVAWITRSSLGQDNTGMTTGNATADTKIQTDSKETKQIIVTTIPSGYHDWKFISAAQAKVAII